MAATVQVAPLGPPTPLAAYVESSHAGHLLFLSGVLPVVYRTLGVQGRLGDTLSVEDGRKAARIAALNALAAAKQHVGDLDRLKKLVKLTVLMSTTEQFIEHASVADGASELFVEIFGSEAGHIRLVYGVQSLPIGVALVVDTILRSRSGCQAGRDRWTLRLLQSSCTKRRNLTDRSSR